MRRTVIVTVCALALLAACSSSDKKSSATTTTTAAVETTTSTTAASTATTTTTVPSATTTTTVAHSATTTTVANTSTVKITSFQYIGDNPAQCNSPTQAELKWNTSGAQKVVLAIDNGVYATFPNGSHDGLFPLACDGKTHTYSLKASAGSRSATSSVSVTTKKTS